MILRNIRLIILFLLLSGCTEFFEFNMPENHPHANPVGISTLFPQLAVININVAQGEFDYMFTNYWDEIDVYGTMAIIRGGGQTAVEIPGTRFSIKGLSSRSFDMKSLGIRFNEVQDNSSGLIFQTGQIYEYHDLNNIESLRLRNSGSDFIALQNATMIKDISYTKLAVNAGLDLDLMYAEQAVVFINNSFYGILNLRTESTARGIAGLYNVDPGQITLGKVVYQDNISTVEIQNGSYQRINNFLKAIEEFNVGYLKNEIDVNNFIDYVIFNTFTANRDWPFNNVRFFAIDNSPFRFFLFDLDQSNISHLFRDHKELMQRGVPNVLSDLFFIFYEEEDFREAFYYRYKELLLSGLFDPSVFRSITLDYYKRIESLMPLHIEKYNQPAAMAEWFRNIELLNLNYETRFEFVSRYILR